jgi:hypothetical protein
VLNKANLPRIDQQPLATGAASAVAAGDERAKQSQFPPGRQERQAVCRKGVMTNLARTWPRKNKANSRPDSGGQWPVTLPVPPVGPIVLNKANLHRSRGKIKVLACEGGRSRAGTPNLRRDHLRCQYECAGGPGPIVRNKMPATKVQKVEPGPRFGADIGDYSGRFRLLSGASNKANLLRTDRKRRWRPGPQVLPPLGTSAPNKANLRNQADARDLEQTIASREAASRRAGKRNHSRYVGWHRQGWPAALTMVSRIPSSHRQGQSPWRCHPNRQVLRSPARQSTAVGRPHRGSALPPDSCCLGGDNIVDWAA